MFDFAVINLFAFLGVIFMGALLIQGLVSAYNKIRTFRSKSEKQSPVDVTAEELEITPDDPSNAKSLSIYDPITQTKIEKTAILPLYTEQPVVKPARKKQAGKTPVSKKPAVAPVKKTVKKPVATTKTAK